MLLRLTVFLHLSVLPTISFWIVVARWLSAVLAEGKQAHFSSSSAKVSELSLVSLIGFSTVTCSSLNQSLWLNKCHALIGHPRSNARPLKKLG